MFSISVGTRSPKPMFTPSIKLAGVKNAMRRCGMVVRSVFFAGVGGGGQDSETRTIELTGCLL